MNELKFTKSTHDKCLFYRKDGENLSIIILYVDDFLAFSKHQEVFEEIYKVLIKNFDEVTRKDGDRQ